MGTGFGGGEVDGILREVKIKKSKVKNLDYSFAFRAEAFCIFTFYF